MAIESTIIKPTSSPFIFSRSFENGFFDCYFYTEYAGNHLRITGAGAGFHYYK